MAIYFLGLPNIAHHPIFTISTLGPEPTAGEASLLKTEEPSQTSRITTHDPLFTKWYVETVGLFEFNFDHLAIVNTNLSDAGYFRVTSAYHTFNTLTPNAISGGVNITGTVSRIQEATSSTDGQYIIPTNVNQAWEVVIDFTTDGATAVTGQAMAIPTLRVIKGGGAPAIAYPTIKIEVRESGVLKQSMGWRAVSEAAQILIFPFDPAILSDLTLANVQIKVYGYPGDNNSYCGLDSAVINYDNVLNLPAVDSGYILADQSIYSSPAYGIVPTKSVHYLRDTLALGRSVLNVILLDDGTERNPPLATTGSLVNSALIKGLSLRPPGYLEAGVFISGESIKVDPGIGTDVGGPTETVNVESTTGTAVGGHTYSANVYFLRGMPRSLEVVCDRTIKDLLLSRIGWNKGKTRPFYVVQDADLALTYQKFSAFYCTCNKISASPIGGIGRSSGTDRSKDKFIVTIELEEKK